MRNQELDAAIKKIRSMKISSLLSEMVEFTRRSGRHSYALCPFHYDTSEGSFVVTDGMNRYQCFACGAKGDAIQFFKDKYGIASYGEAAVVLGRQMGLLNQSGASVDTPLNKTPQKSEQHRRPSYKKEKADDSTLNKVYSYFLEECQLTPAHYHHLIRERGMKEKEISAAMYRSFPQEDRRKEITGNVIRKLWKAYGKEWEDVLNHVPGFYQVKLEDGWRWTFYRAEGLMIPIRNVMGEIRGIQIRKENEGKGGRYMWFSSSFAVDMGEKIRRGTTSGSPVDIVNPKAARDSRIVITEGRFKAAAVARTWGITALSVQGVGNSAGIFGDLEEIARKSESIFIAFDADAQRNPQVKHQVQKLTHLLEKEGYTIRHLEWEEEYGKGIDDLIQNKNQNKIKVS